MPSAPADRSAQVASPGPGGRWATVKRARACKGSRGQIHRRNRFHSAQLEGGPFLCLGAPRPAPLPMTQRRVLLLIDNIESDYQIEVISGVLRATRASNVNTVVVAGGWLSTPEVPTPRNFVYDLIPGARVDGIIVSAGSLSNQIGLELFRQWLGRLGGAPVVCLGLDVPGYPSVYVDNGAGAYAAISHLIERHGRTKIGCLRGPPGSAEGAQRYDAYCRALQAHGLTQNASLVWAGQVLGREDGHAAIRALFDERGVSRGDVDAFASFNDDMALGAIEALTARGLAVPDQIALVGFDDAPNARAANPPLTTVNQQVELQAYGAGRALVEALEGGRPPRGERLDSVEVIRGSCGCSIGYQNDSRSIERTQSGGRSLAAAFLGRQTLLKAEMARAAAGRLGGQNGWEDKLVAALASDLQNADGAFRYALESIARRSINSGGNVDPCSDMLTALRLLVLGITGGHSELRPRIEDVFQEARTMLTHVGLSAYRERDQAANNHLRNIAQTCMATLATRESAALSRALSTHLPPLGVSACTISRLTESKTRGPELSLLAQLSPDFAPARAGTLPLASLGVDQALHHRAGIVLMPLDFAGQPLGVVGFAWGAFNPLIYEQLREWFSIVLYATGPQQNGPQQKS